ECSALTTTPRLHRVILFNPNINDSGLPTIDFRFFFFLLINYLIALSCFDVLEEEEKNEKRQKLVRKKQQEAQGEKASRYIENVLKPHREMKLRKLEERFYQMTGEAWKLSSGHKLGGDEGTSQTSFETSNREAAKSQNLPKPLTEFPSPAVQPTCKEIPDLPEEPSQTAEEVVTVALRCPSGNVLRRRFLKSCSSQVLLDWMMRIGYHTSLYSLSTSFPRRPLAVEGGQSLEDVGITVDTVLILEEKEQTN
uniref:UBX domain-containing protein 8 n=1 Tax=Macaca nemestrina TaxID=9545 RepID=A0A2K6CZX2_MACNE